MKSDRVVLSDGQEVPYDYLVLATGKKWGEPNDVPDYRAAAIEQMKIYRDRVAAAKEILVIGGGAVGIEIAGEIVGTYPHKGPNAKKVTLIHKGAKLMNDTYNDKFRNSLQKQCLDMGINLHLGDALDGSYDFATSPHTVTTKNGDSLAADLIIQATGGSVNNEYLQSFLDPSLLTPGGVKVKPTFQVEGHDNVFVIGDLADLPEQKQAAKLPGHASVVNSNIVNIINGKPLVVRQLCKHCHVRAANTF